MNKSTGILFLLVYVCGVTALLNPKFLSQDSIYLIMQESSLFAIVGLGVAFVIITGGIDLSIGSMVGLVGCVFAMMIQASEGKPASEVTAQTVWILGWNTIAWGVFWILAASWEKFMRAQQLKVVAPVVVIAAGIGLLIFARMIEFAAISNWGMWLTIIACALALAMQLGLIHGLLITKLKLQPFVVTLCGLMIYRGLCRWLTGDQTIGFGTQYNDSLSLLASGRPCTIAFLIAVAGALIAVFYLFVSIVNLRRSNYSNLLTSVIFLAIGACMAVAGGSRYFDGWEIIGGVPIFQIGGLRVTTWEAVVPEVAIQRPSIYLAQIGRYGTVFSFFLLAGISVGMSVKSRHQPFLSHRVLFLITLVACAIATVAIYFLKHDWFAIGALSSLFLPVGLAIGLFAESSEVVNWKKYIAVLMALVAFGISAFVVYQAKIIGSPAYSLKDFQADFSISFTELAFARFKMFLVMLALALFTASVAWFVRAVFRAYGPIVRGPLIAIGAFAIMWWIGDQAPEFQKTLVTMPFLIMLVLAAIGWVALNKTIFGRYILALGRNEEAARFSGIDTDKMVMITYVICAGVTGVFAILFSLNINSIQPSELGSFIELYAIAAAVLGGCSLRGGEGSVVGVIIGASIVRILYNSMNLIHIPSQLEFTIIGVVILSGAIVDEVVRRLIAKRRTVESFAEDQTQSA